MDQMLIKPYYTGANVTGLGEFQPGDTVSISQGGTGATTAAQARANLGVIGGGSVNEVSFADGNGFTGSVATPTTTPEISVGTSLTGVLKGTGTGLAVAVSGVDFKTIGGASLLGSGDIPVAGTGTVTTVSVASANGFTGSVANPTTTPQITLTTSLTGLLKGDGTALQLATNADLPVMTATVGGAVPTPPNNTTTFLRGDGTFATPPGSGTVTSVSVVSANGMGGSVATATTTPAITLTTSITGLVKANGTAFSAASAGSDYLAPPSGTSVLKANSGGALANAVPGTDFVSPTGTETLTNKRVTTRVGSATSSATPSINTDNVDVYKLTAQAVDVTSFTTNLTGTPTDNQFLIIEITGTAARALAWGSSFEASTVALPTTTVGTAMLAVAFMWNTATSKWRCVAAV